MTAAFRCCVAAELAGDPMEASAPPADRWLLVEHTGPWGRRAITESRLDPEVVRAFGRWTTTNRTRVALIRRPRAAHRRRERHGCWYTVDSRPGREAVRAGRYEDEHDLLEVLADAGAGTPHHEPIYLVCTHGRHDTCCAMRGRPVAQALAAAFRERTWECTHVGGDRFSANLVVLPHGLFYGRVPPQHAVELAKLHESGHLDLQWLRGRCSLPAPAQAAQHHARLHTGETALDAFPVLACEATDGGGWRVSLGGPRPVTLHVRARLVATDRALTCTGPHPDRYRVFDVLP